MDVVYITGRRVCGNVYGVPGILAAAVPKVLAMNRLFLVLGFWRDGLDVATADQIETRLGQLAAERAERDNCREAVGNVFLLEATRG